MLLMVCSFFWKEKNAQVQLFVAVVVLECLCDFSSRMALGRAVNCEGAWSKLLIRQ